MPIKFRCQHCRQFLGISRSRAGEVVDCPTCGRTIRVPNLDGTIEPLPEPKLDVSELAGVLDELAKIGEDEEDKDGEAAADSAAPHEAAVKPQPVVVQELAPLPQPEPVAIEPPLPAEPVALSEPKEQQSAQAAAEPSPDVLQPLQWPAGYPPAAPATAASSLRELLKRPAVLLVLLLTGAAVFSIGWLAARRTVPAEKHPENTSPSPQANRGKTPADDGRKQPLLTQPAEWKVAFRGRISYVDENRKSRPDKGACLIVLPQRRVGGTVKIPAAALRHIDPKDANGQADFRLAVAALRSLGGNAVLADEDGRYAIRLPPSAGTFHLIAISNHRSVELEHVLLPGLRTLLEQFFDQPLVLFRQLDFKHTERRFDGENAITWNHEFE